MPCLSLRPVHLSQRIALLAGGTDLRTSEHRPKKAKQALQLLGGTPAPQPAVAPPTTTTTHVAGSVSAAQPVEVRVFMDGIEHVVTGMRE